MTKRSPSVLTTLTRAARKGVMLEAVLPDGTIIRPVSDSVSRSGRPTDQEAAEADKAFNGAFGKGI